MSLTRHWIAAIFLLIFVSAGGQQQDGSIEMARRHVSRKLDSLPLMVTTGLATADTSLCHLRNHSRYFVNGLTSGLPAGSSTWSGQKRKQIIDLYGHILVSNEFYEQRDYIKSQIYCLKALKLSVANGFKFEELHLLRPALNNIFLLSSNYAKAIELSLDGIKSAESIGDLNRIGHFSNVAGYVHMKQRRYVLAERYFFAGLNAATQLRDDVFHAQALENLGELSLAREKYDSASYFFDAALDLYKTAKFQRNDRRFEIHEREAYIFSRLAEVSLFRGELKKSQAYILKSVRIGAKSTGINDYDRGRYFIDAARLYNHMQRFDSSLILARLGLEVSRQIFHRENCRDAFQQLATAFSGQKQNDSALHYLWLYANLKDSLADEAASNEVLMQEAMALVEKNEQSHREAIERQRSIRNAVVLVAIFTVIVVFLMYRRYKLKQDNKFRQEHASRQEQLVHRTIITQNNERKRIAQDLHDELGSILSAAKLKLSSIDGTQAILREERQKIEDSMMLIGEAVREMKNIAYNIMPATLSRLGLVAAVDELLKRISDKTDVHVSFVAHGFDTRLSEVMEINLYMMILECINNIVNHAAAKKVTVQLLKHYDYVHITVEDDGIGFDENTVIGGNGMLNITSRAKYLGGNFRIDTRRGFGTTILIDVPLPD